MNLRRILSVTTFGLALVNPAWADITLLNVSYDPTRKLYQEFNAAFAKQWQAKAGEKVIVRQSHGGGSQERGSGEFDGGANRPAGTSPVSSS